MLESITGIRAPSVRAPHALIYLVALVSEGVARATGRPPRVPLTGVRMARRQRQAVEWFTAYGYAPPPPAYRARVA